MLPIDWAPMRIFKRTADVNLWGLIEMTKTFLPLVKMARGRVVNFASVGGKLLACEQALLFGQARPLAASPLARVFSRDSFHSPK